MLTQSEVAERAGISMYTVTAAEGGRGISPKTGRALANALGLEPEELLEEAALPKAPGRPSPEALEEASEEERRDREELLAAGLPHLMYAWAKKGRTLPEEISKDKPGRSMAVRTTEFYDGLAALEAMYEELPPAKQSSQTLQEAKEQLDMICARLGTLWNQTAHPSWADPDRNLRKFHEQRAKNLRSREAGNAEDPQDLRAEGDHKDATA